MTDTTAANSVSDIRQAWGPQWASASDQEIICAYSASAHMPAADVARALRYDGTVQCPAPTTQHAGEAQDTSDFVPICIALSAILAVVFLVAALHHQQQRRAGSPDAVEHPVLSPYGRLGRGAYARRVGLMLLAALALVLTLRVSNGDLGADGARWFALPLSVVWTITSAKRLRDAGRAPAWAYLQLVPVVGLALAGYCLIAGTQEIQPEPSKYVAQADRPGVPASEASLPAPVPSGETVATLAKPAVSPQVAPTDEQQTLGEAEQDEHMWAAALAELEQARRPGAWARAYSEAMGDDGKARAIYLALRVQQMALEQRAS